MTRIDALTWTGGRHELNKDDNNTRSNLGRRKTPPTQRTQQIRTAEQWSFPREGGSHTDHDTCEEERRQVTLLSFRRGALRTKLKSQLPLSSEPSQ